MTFTKTSESAFKLWFVESLRDANLPTPSSPHAKLVGLLKLRSGWYNGRGDSISSTAVRIAGKLLRKANGGVIETVDVFPRFDGGVTVALYYSGRDLAFNIKPDGSVDIDSETDLNFPLLEGLSESHALFIIKGLRQWNLSYYSTYPNTTRISTRPGFEALVSNDLVTARGYPYLSRSVPQRQQAPYVLMPGLSMAR